MGLPAGLSSCSKTKTPLEWLRRNFPAFISAEDWPSGSPDLNFRDNRLWAVLEDMPCQKCHNNLDSLKRSLTKVAAEIPLETVCAVIAQWPEGLKACVEAEGGHFEWQIINKNLKLLVIHYLPRKLDVLFRFSSR